MTILEDEEMNESLSEQLQNLTGRKPADRKAQADRKPAAGRNQATGRKATRKPLRLNKNGIPMETERPPFTRGKEDKE